MNRMHIVLHGFALVPALISMLIVGGEASASENASKYTTFVAYFENDLFGGTDKYYSSAVKLSWLSSAIADSGADGGPPGWVRWLTALTPAADRKALYHTVALSLGQNVYTPEDIGVAEVVENDRPYAGWLYFAAALQTKNDDFLNSLELNIGVVGPSSLAEQTQTITHKWLNDVEPLGWDNQLKDEPGLMIAWQRFWRVIRKSAGHGLAYDVIPHVGITVGNVMTYANAGGELRFGYNLPADFGSSLIRPAGNTVAPVGTKDPRVDPSSNFGLSLFVGIDGRAVARNIFLDGNTFRDSASVDKNYLVADISAGVSAIYKRFMLSYTHVYRTEEFQGQDGGQFFGSISLIYTF